MRTAFVVAIVAMKVAGEVITSCLLFTPKEIRAKCKAAVPELMDIA